MIGDAILYAVRSATSTAVGNVERKVAWTSAAGALLLCALVAALLVAFQLLEPRVGVSKAQREADEQGSVEDREPRDGVH